ncbi:MAG: cadherin repeat domain-containing protein, partial [Planctomyces sp.]|nr:cadherin repeat domain-containing protein [Planctomyces sp.]
MNISLRNWLKQLFNSPAVSRRAGAAGKGRDRDRTQAGLVQFAAVPQALEERFVLSALAIGEVVTSEIGNPGDRDEYTFSLGSDSKLWFDGLNAASGIDWSLKGPAGQEIVNQAFHDDWSSSSFLNLVPGNYTLTVDGAGDSVGSYSFRLLDVSSGTTLSDGVSQSHTLNPGSEADIYKFSVTRGDRFDIEVTTGDTSSAYFRVFDPIGRPVSEASGWIGSTVSDQWLLMDGDYTLVLAGGLNDSGNTVNYDVKVTKVGFTAPPNLSTGATALTLGSVRTGTIAGTETDKYRFTTTAPTLMYFDELYTSPGNFYWTLEGPTGIEVDSRWFGSDPHWYGVGNNLLNLPVIGTYQIRIFADPGVTGTYSFRMLDLAAAVDVTPGEVKTGTLTNNINDGGTTVKVASRADYFKFTAAAGDRIFMDTQSSNPQNAYWALIDPLGRPVVSYNLYSDLETEVLTLSGTYTVIVAGNYTDTDSVSYAFRIQPASTSTEPLNVGPVVTGEITETGDIDEYTFSLENDSQLWFDGLSNTSGINWSLRGPSGSIVANREISDDGNYWWGWSATAMSLVEGDYVLTVDGTGGSTGGYSFRLLDFATAIEVTPGDIVSGTLDPANSTTLYKIDVVAGDRLYFDDLTSGGNAAWHLIDPLGRTVATSWLSSDMEFGTLTLPGTYTLAIVGSFDDTGTTGYSFRVQPSVTSTSALSIGAVVSGAITNAGDVDQFTFTLAGDSQLWFDGLSTSSGLSWSLSGPTGAVVSSQGIENDGGYWWGWTNNAMSLVAGAYTLTVDAALDSTGEYSFRLLDLNAAVEVTPGDIVTGTLDPANSTSLYQFDAVAGDRFFFDSLVSSGNAAWHVIDPLGRQFAVNWLSGDLEPGLLTLPGTYRVAVVGDFGDTGTIDYSFRIQPSAITSEPLTVGSIVSGEITNAGDVDRYTFTLLSDSQLWFDGLEDFSGAFWSLTGPSGHVVTSTYFDDPWANNSNLNLIQGDYVLTLDGSGDSIGNYSFRLLDVAAGTVLSSGVSQSHTLSPASEADIYKFSVTRGDRFDIEVTTGDSSNAYFRVYDPLGRLVSGAEGWIGSTVPNQWLLMNGNYSLVVSGSLSETDIVNYDVKVTKVGTTSPPNLGTGTTALTLGAVRTSTISADGEIDKYRFTTTAPALMYFDALYNSPSGNFYWTLEGPTGIEADSRSFASDSHAYGFGYSLLDLPVVGTYQIRIFADAGVTGTYSFRMLDLADAVDITPGVVKSGTLTNTINDNGNSVVVASRADYFKFTAAAGDRFFMDTQSSNPQAAYWALIDPLGQTVVAYYLSADQETEVLTLPGVYTVIVAGNFRDPDSVSYAFNIQPALTSTEPLTVGSVITGEITETGDTDLYTFTLGSDSKLTFDGLSGLSGIRWSLNGPSGAVVTDQDFYNDGGYWGGWQNSTLSLVAGDYTLTVDGSGDSTGGYSFRLLDLSTATEITPGTMVTGTLDPANSKNMYKFDVVAGDRLYLNSLTDSGNAGWYLIDPLGRNVTSYWLTGDQEPAQLTLPGTYTLVISGWYEDTGTFEYAFNVQPAVTTSEPLTVGAVVSGAITNAGDTNEHTFNLATDSQLWFDGLSTSSGISWSLKGPSGTVVDSRGINDDGGVWWSGTNLALNLVKGEYTLTVDGSGDSTGGYSFRLIDLSTAASITPGTVVSGTLDPANSTKLYNFEVLAGERFYLDNLVGGGNSAWQLIDPLGRTVTVYWLSGDQEPAPLTLPGTYTLAIIGAFDDTGTTDYSFNVQPAEVDGVDTVLSNSIISESSAANSVVGEFVTSGLPGSASISYTFTSGSGDEDNTRFSISNSELRIIQPLDYEFRSIYSIRVHVTDGGTISFDRVFSVIVTDVNESPTSLNLSNSSLAENSGVNAVIGTLTGSDPDAGDTLTYSLPNGVDDNALFNLSGSTLRANDSFDFEAGGSYTITAVVQDEAGLTYDRQFTITITNVNESPTSLNLSNSSLAENSGVNAVIGTLTGSDPDAGDTLTYSL